MPRSAAHNEAISAGLRRKWQDPDYRARVVARMHSPDYQAQRIDSWKARQQPPLPRPLPPTPMLRLGHLRCMHSFWAAVIAKLPP